MIHTTVWGSSLLNSLLFAKIGWKDLPENNQMVISYCKICIHNGTFHEQHSIGYGFPSLLLATRASADVSELVFKHEWRSHECLKTIPTHPLRHTWPEVVMGNHTRSSAVHGRSFHKGLTKRSMIFV